MKAIWSAPETPLDDHPVCKPECGTVHRGCDPQCPKRWYEQGLEEGSSDPPEPKPEPIVRWAVLGPDGIKTPCVTLTEDDAHEWCDRRKRTDWRVVKLVEARDAD